LPGGGVLSGLESGVISMAIRTVVVGLGMGKWHCNGVKATAGMELAGVCDIDAARLALATKEYGVKGYATLDAVLADPEVDLVTLVTRHDQHCDMAVAALGAGKHVVLDKPFCLCVAEADRMIAARDRAKRMLSCFHCRRWDPDYLTVRRALDTGAIGRMLQIQINQAGFHGQGGWRRNRKHMGGLFYDWGAHFADQLCQLGGAPAVSVSGRVQYGPHGHEVEDFIHVIVEFGNGVLALVSQSGISHFAGPRWIVSGEKGSLKEDGQGHDTWDNEVQPAFVRASLNGVPAEIKVDRLPGSWKSYYQNVSEHLNEGKELIVTAEQARAAVELMQAAYISAEDGRIVALPLKGAEAARVPSKVRPVKG